MRKRSFPVRLLAILMAALILTVAVAGCSSSTPKPAEPAAQPAGQGEPAPPPAPPKEVTITYWHTYSTDSNENKMLVETVIPAFQAKFPHIKVESVVQPYDGLHDSLVAGVAGGQVPDLMRMDIIWVPEFAKLGGLEPLDGYAGFNELKSQVFPGPLATNYYDGKYYGLPLDTNTQVVVYRKDFLAQAGLSEPPKTMDEFKAYAAQFKGADGKHALALGGTYPWQLLPWFWTLGGQITSADYTRATGFTNSPASVAALQTLADLFKQGSLAPSMIGGQPSSWDGIKGGQYGAVLEGPWFFAIMGGDIGDQIVGAPVPAGPAGTLSVVGGEDIVMFAGARHKPEAWEFIKFMLSDEAQAAMARTGQMPVTFSASDSAAMKEVGYYGPYVEQLKTALPRTPVPTWNQIDKELGLAFEKVFRGEAEPQAALDEAAKNIDALLAE